MRVMSFNVRGAYWTQDGENYWPKRAALNVATILRHQPDLIGFQEFQDGNAAVYADQLATYRMILGPRYGNRTPFEYPAIAWNPARLRLTGAGGFWLSETPLIYSIAWETACIRSAQWARFQPIAGGSTFVILNTHLDHISAKARSEGARLIMARLSEIALPDERLIITGDFNCDPDTPPYQILTTDGMTDCFRMAGELDGPEASTYHGFKGRGYQLKNGRSERIDWVLARGWQVQSFMTVRDDDPPRYPSDHYPVLAELGEESEARR